MMAEPNGHIFDAASAKRIAEVVRYVERMMANGQPRTNQRHRKEPVGGGTRWVKLTQDLYRDAVVFGNNAILCSYDGTNDDPYTEVEVKMDYRIGYWFQDDIIEVRRIGEELQAVYDGYTYFGGMTNTTAITQGGGATRELSNGKEVTISSPYGDLAADALYSVHWEPTYKRWEAVAAECP